MTPVSCPGPLGGFALDVTSLDGAPLGTAKTCIKSIDGCDWFAPYCLRTVRATLTLDAEGRVAGGGSAAFDNQGTFTGRLVYTAHLTGVR